MSSIRKVNVLDSSVIFQDDGDNSKRLQLELATISTSTTRIISIPDADTTFVGTDVAQTLTNKSIDADNNTITNIDNADIKTAAAIDATKIADGSISNTEFQLLNGLTSTVVGISDSQTLTNKTINADNNTISNIDNNEIKAAAGIDATKIADGSISNTEFQQLNGITSAVVGVSDSQTLTNKTFTDSSTQFQDETDNTKKLEFQLNGITTGNTRTLTIPDASTTIVGTNATQTLTNKTITSSTNTISASQLMTAGSDVVVSAASAPSNGQVLTATSSTTATWQTPSGGSITYHEITNENFTSQNSSSPTIISGMQYTPASGTYLVMFSSSGYVDDTNIRYIYFIYSNGVEVGPSRRSFASTTTAVYVRSVLFTTTIVTVNGSQQIDVRAERLDGTSFDSLDLYNKTLVLVKLA